MTTRIVVLAAFLNAALLAGQDVVARIVSGPLPSPENIAALELRVLHAPEDLDARMALLRVYLDSAPPTGYDEPGRRSVRLQQILYLIDRHPEAEVNASKAAYVYRASGPYANAADHDAVRDRWLAAVQGRPRDRGVTMNAVKFLEMEDAQDAEQVLKRAMAAEPENREIAANLGFLYAMQIVRSDLASPAATELEQSSDAIVLAAAGTALPNLAVKSVGGRTVDPKIFDFANQLSARARQLAPDDADIQGPMPLIQYFAAAQEGMLAAPPRSNSPMRIKVGENVQAFNLIRKTAPNYPEEARQAGVTGEVRMTVTISRDGTVQNIQLVSGHPLLVQSAVQAVQTWLYKPTLLNGAPVEVLTTVTVSFPPN
jgi:TonB family protein